MLSSRGQPGGKRIGDSMVDYPIEGHCFRAVSAEQLAQDFRISWCDRVTRPAALQVGQNSFGLTVGLPDGAQSVAALEGVDMAAVGAGLRRCQQQRQSVRVHLQLRCEPMGQARAEHHLWRMREGVRRGCLAQRCQRLVRNAPGAPVMQLGAIGAAAAAQCWHAGPGGPPGCGQPLARPVWTA